MTNAPDPFSMFRDAVTHWEKLANEWGGQMLSRPESAQAMHQATTLALKAQQGAQDAMAKLLSAANMPSKEDIAALSARMAAIEAALLRIEAKIGANEPLTPTEARPVRRTRRPA
jgi:hypothetical protein